MFVNDTRKGEIDLGAVRFELQCRECRDSALECFLLFALLLLVAIEQVAFEFGMLVEHLGIRAR